MVDDIDIYRSAQIYIKKYGHAAKKEAALTALGLEAELSAEALAVWCRIISAIDVLQNEQIDSGKH